MQPAEGSAREARAGDATTLSARVVAVHCKGSHAFSKDSADSIQLLAGQGVVGDAHCGATVKHRSRVARDPTRPNLRQVHLMHSELFDELARRGLHVLPGQMGENITTAGLPLLDLARDTELRIGAHTLVRVTGLRNPCAQIEAFMPGLLAAVRDRAPQGQLVRKAGIMAIVLESGSVNPGDTITIEHRPRLHVPLRPV